MKPEKTKLDLDELKKGGILKQRQKDYFILRARIPGGYLKADMLPKFMQIAKNMEEVIFTSQQDNVLRLPIYTLKI